jgi:hypothetical protein
MVDPDAPDSEDVEERPSGIELIPVTDGEEALRQAAFGDDYGA